MKRPTNLKEEESFFPHPIRKRRTAALIVECENSD
jgi:hypothetical protein